MAKKRRDDENFKLSKHELKYAALVYVQQWANINIYDTEEDFYNSVALHDVPSTFNHPDNTDEFELTEEEKEWARQEFIAINNWLSKRRAKYTMKINQLSS